MSQLRKTTFLLAIGLTLCASQAADAGVISFYGGDPALDFAFDSGNNGALVTWEFDDFDWNGGRVGELFGNFVTFGDATITGMEFEIRTGVSAGVHGTVVASGQAPAFTWNDTGVDFFGFDVIRGTADVADFDLAAGTYFLGVRPVYTGTGTTTVLTTEGANGIGTPLDNGNSFAVVGSATPVSTDFLGVSFDMSQGVVAVPVPPAAWLGLGMLGLLGLAKRRRAARRDV